MLENSQEIESLLDVCHANGVMDRGLDIARAVANNPPARRVNSRSMSPNITCRFPSRKMRQVIQAESRSLELPNIYLKEFDDTVMAYWDQPFHRPNLVYKSGKRTVRVPVTLDFFVISEGFIGFEECKPYEVLMKEASKSSERYHYDSDSNTFSIPPLGEYLDGTGLGYRIITDRDICATYVENLALLYDFLDEPVALKDKQLWAVARKLCDVSGGVRLSDLECSVNGLSRLSVLTAIAHKELYVDLYEVKLQEPERALVYASLDLIPEQHKEPLITADDSISFSGSVSDMQTALRRYKVVDQIVRGGNLREVSLENNVSTRTIQRWLKEYRVDGLSGLEPKHRNKGNYGSKLSGPVEDCISEAINEFYLDDQGRTATHVYGLLKEQCKERNLLPPSREAFFCRLRNITDRDAYKVREGAKRAYQFTGYEGVENNNAEETAFRSVSRFLERCHIEHTQSDIQLVSVDGADLGRPWLTLITDEYTGFVLAVYLSFRKPATHAVMSSIRLMVARYKVFPAAIVVDGGKEFESIYFEGLMARRRSAIISRKGKPRSGSSVERTYGAFNTVLLDNLSGNNKLAKNVRQLSASHNPKNLAIWEAVDFYEELVSFVDEWNSVNPKAGGLAPRDLKAKSVERFGLPAKRIVEFDSDFMRDTLPAPKRPTADLKRNQKIQVNRVPYWHGCLRTIPRSGVTADIRYDPFNLNYVYVHYQNKWIKFKATTQQHRQLDDLDSAIVAEITRQTLYVNEKAKTEARSKLAVTVEDINEKAVEKHRSRMEGSTENPESLLVVEDMPDQADDSGEDFWSLDIPAAVEVE